MDDTLDTLSGTSTPDLISGYWQVEMSSPDQKKTVFCTHEGFFEFQVTLIISSHLSIAHEHGLGLLTVEECWAYLDDIYHYIGKTFAEHYLLTGVSRTFQAPSSLYETRRSVEHCTPHADGAWLNELG